LPVDLIGPDPGTIDDTPAFGKPHPAGDFIGQCQIPQFVSGIKLATRQPTIIESDTANRILSSNLFQYEPTVGTIQNHFLIQERVIVIMIL